jgi:hypothetical protein
LPDTTGRFGLIQVLDQYGRAGLALSPGEIAAEAPHYDSVWGAFQPSTWRAYNGGIILSRYYMPFEDNTLVSGNTLSYFQQNHPDWILYGCDKNGNPTTDYAWSGTGFQDTPLNIHNPAVVQYQLQTIVNYLRQNGYNAIAIDNVTFVNFLQSPNAVLEPGKRPVIGSPPQGNSNYGCGVYTQGPGVPNSFQRIYTAGFDEPDGTFTADLLNWVHQAQITLHQNGFKVIVNHPPAGSTPTADEQTLLNYIDGMLDENGYTHYGTLLTGGAFAKTLNWVQLLQSRGIAALVTDYYCSGTSGCSNDPSTLSPQQVDWALASYALGNNGGENVYISPHGGAIPSYRGEYSLRYGTPCSGVVQNGFVYTRRFSGGFAVVNASGSSTVVQLPNHTYTDIEHRAVSNPLNVAPTDAYMLLTNGNGCS